VTKDHPDDRSARLDRAGAFRLNVSAGAAEFARWVGRAPRDPAGDEPEPGVPDVVVAHPVYGGLGWLAVVEPGPRTRTAVLELLRTAHRHAQKRYERRSAAADPA
jgi:hypothetical protein